MDKDDLSEQERNFLSTISHEIRTPLNAISGISQLLAETDLDNTQSEFVDIIQKAGSNLLSMLDDLLDVSRLQSNDLKLNEDVFEITDTVQTVISKYNSLANEKNISISFENTPEVAGTKILDQKRFNQCLSSLIGNAVKFTETGKISVSCWIDQTSNSAGELYVSVTDSGPGMSSEDLKEVFSFNHDNKQKQPSFDGSGLGLIITNQLANLMGGSLEAVSTIGSGSTFTLCVSYKLPEEKPETSLQASGHILIVEDNPTNQRLLQLVLGKLGHTCSLANDGKQGAELFLVEKFDLILMDLHMPVMDGFAATAEIRGSGAYNADLPIIALTADVRHGIEQRVYDAGMDTYLSKPFEVPVLAATIDAAIEMSGEQQQARTA
ncbi:MAG: response regulator [Robiginitomaculum sp.]|nr:response regulator [Robiginitomaculum sp.]